MIRITLELKNISCIEAIDSYLRNFYSFKTSSEQALDTFEWR